MNLLAKFFRREIRQEPESPQIDPDDWHLPRTKAPAGSQNRPISAQYHGEIRVLRGRTNLLADNDFGDLDRLSFAQKSFEGSPSGLDSLGVVARHDDQSQGGARHQMDQLGTVQLGHRACEQLEEMIPILLLSCAENASAHSRVCGQIKWRG